MGSSSKVFGMGRSKRYSRRRASNSAAKTTHKCAKNQPKIADNMKMLNINENNLLSSAERERAKRDKEQKREQEMRIKKAEEREKERLAKIAAQRQKIEMAKLRAELSKNFYRVKKSAKRNRG